MKCFYCQHTHSKYKKQDISKEFLFRILKELKELKVKDVGLFWLGESLLVNELSEYISFAKKIGIEYVFITTNGILATPERINKIIDSGIDSIKFSINVGSREKYLKSSGVDAFDQLISNLKHTWKYRGSRKTLSIYASTVVDPTNAKEYDYIHSLIAPYVDHHYPIVPYGKLKIVTENGEYRIIDAPKEERRTLQEMLPCWPLFTEPHISSDGHMSVCYCDLDERLYVGDLNKMSLMEAWHSEKFAALRKQHLLKDVVGTVCESCIAYR